MHNHPLTGMVSNLYYTHLEDEGVGYPYSHSHGFQPYYTHLEDEGVGYPILSISHGLQPYYTHLEDEGVGYPSSKGA